MSSIIAPFGEPIEARPAVPSEEERVSERKARRGKRGGDVDGSLGKKGSGEGERME